MWDNAYYKWKNKATHFWNNCEFENLLCFQWKGIYLLGAFGFCLQVLIWETVKPPKCLSAASFRRSVQQILEPVASSSQATKRQIPWNGLCKILYDKYPVFKKAMFKKAIDIEIILSIIK